MSEDKKIGLVLSGGGAKGFAHIGVLKVLDSLGVKPDYIAGTSMGAIVGSLYASGYSGKELDSIFEITDFDAVINDLIPRSSLSFFERKNTERYAISLPFDDFKIQLPSGISRGQNVYNLLSRLTFHNGNIKNFEDLPIPFFCIATNVETGKAVILDEGNLALAVTASGAFPSLFQPVEINGELLIDGGVINNYPIDELKAKGMDIIIGVDVQDDLALREDLKTAPGILVQINNFRTIKAMESKSQNTDIYIKPDITDFNVIDFDEGKRIIENGKLAALRKTEELKSVSRLNSSEIQEKPRIKDIDTIFIKNINIDESTKYSRAFVLGKLKLRGNEKVSYKKFIKGVDNLMGTDNFDSFRYNFEKNDDGYDLSSYLSDSESTTSLKLGVHFDDLYKSAALINYTQKQFLVNNDVVSLDLMLGDNVRYEFDYFIDKGFYWSIGLNSRFNTFHKNVSASLLLTEDEISQTGLNLIDIELSDFTNQLYLQTLFRRDFSLTMGVEHKRLNITSETFSTNDREETEFEKSDFFSLVGELKFDTFDDKYFPTSGFFFDGDFNLYFSSSDFNNNFSQFSIAKAKIGYAFSLSDSVSMLIGSEGGFRIGDDSNNSLNFALGGYGNDLINNFIPFYGYDFISITGNSFVKGNIELDIEWIKNQHIRAGANFSNTGDSIFEGGEWITTPDFSGYAIGYSIETFLGPLEATYSWSPELKGDIWFFNLGFWF